MNDVIYFKWFEVESNMTGTTKWDGIGFVIDESMNLASVISEFSGGILHNSNEKKGLNDEKKLILDASKIISYYQANYDVNVSCLFLRLDKMKMYFEAIY